jgi:hypothetical protein
LRSIVSQTGQFVTKFVPFGFRQIDFVAFDEHVEQEYRHIVSGIKRDDAVASAFALAAAGKSDFPGAAGAGNIQASFGKRGEQSDDSRTFVRGQPRVLRVAEEIGSLDDRMRHGPRPWGGYEGRLNEEVLRIGLTRRGHSLIRYIRQCRISCKEKIAPFKAERHRILR